jgi:flagellar protein FlbD
MGGSMISVTRFNDSTLIINADLIQTVEETPDTVITLTTGTKFIVKEKSKEIVDKVVEYKRRIFVNSPV